MAWTLRCRGPNGQATLAGLDPSTTAVELQRLLHEKTDVQPAAQEILSGFPPKVLAISDGATLASLGITNGETLTVRASAAAPPPAPTPQAAAVAPAATAAPVASAYQDMDDDTALAAAIAASLGEAPPPAQQQPAPQQPLHHHQPGAAGPAGESSGRAVSDAAPGAGGAPISVAMPDGSCVVRRIIASDNSCLFNAVGYVMEHNRAKAAELRQVIAGVVASDPVTYTDGFLGMSNEEYCRWIMDMSKWGGAIELSILATYYGREIAAFDIQTKRLDLYGQDKGYTERAMLIYDGLHYDSLAVSAFEGAPEDIDVTVFQPDGPEGRAAMQAAAKLVEASHAARQFTDTQNFTLRCGVCQIGLKGEKEAVLHAKATGHSNFAEY